jgi:glyoxylase-like metal-dependent hydrolase (beta-lactamase superfamily II)
MAKLTDRNPDSAPGNWYVDRQCIDCGASRTVAPGLVVRRGELSVFARQPADAGEELAAWRAALVCPTASIGRVTRQRPPSGLFPHELAPGVYRCGYNARSSYGAHSYFVVRSGRNLLVDAPRFVAPVVRHVEKHGGIADILLTHRDDVADARRFMQHFRARVWIHEDDRDAAPYATGILRGREPCDVRAGVRAIPVPGHTRGSTVYLVDDCYLFTGDSLAWSFERRDLQAFRDACWYSWAEQARSLARLVTFRFEWVLAGHGGSIRLPADEMRDRLERLVERMGTTAA